MPERIQRRRTKGWRAPAGAVYVGRGTRWGNPYRVVSYGGVWAVTRPALWIGGCDVVSEHVTRQEAQAAAVVQFRRWLTVVDRGRTVAAAAREELRGRDLMCWCPLDGPCHADALIEVANAEGDHAE